MIKKVVALYDTQAKIYCAPFMTATLGEATRSLMDAVNDKSTGTLNKHPQDFILFEIASFDDVSGLYSPCVPPNRIALASDFVEDKKLVLQ